MPDAITDHPAFDFIRAESGIEEYRHIGNGLTVLLMPEAAAPVAAFQVTYRVGSRNEGAGLTGATHLLEHLIALELVLGPDLLKFSKLAER